MLLEEKKFKFPFLVAKSRSIETQFFNDKKIY